MCQHLEDLLNSVTQYFPNGQAHYKIIHRKYALEFHRHWAGKRVRVKGESVKTELESPAPMEKARHVSSICNPKLGAEV